MKYKNASGSLIFHQNVYIGIITMWMKK
uniref:Uncharacterized protein n=1 Tax=Anguilla anguilla TaxID=7936 RepID=A0A0E9PBX4_ANGAN